MIFMLFLNNVSKWFGLLKDDFNDVLLYYIMNYEPF
jgi:hypothetical protein